MSEYLFFTFIAIIFVVVILLSSDRVPVLLPIMSLLTFPFLLSYYYSKSVDRIDELNDITESSINDLHHDGSVHLTPGEAIRILDHRWEHAGPGPKDYLQVKPYYDEKIIERAQSVFPELQTMPQTVRGDTSISRWLGRPDQIEDENRAYENSLYNPTATDMITYFGNLGPFFRSIN